MIQTIGEVVGHDEAVTSWFVGYRAQYEARIGMPIYPSVLNVVVPGEFVMIVPDQEIAPAVFLSGTIPLRSVPCLLNGVQGVILRTTPYAARPGSTHFVIVCTAYAVDLGPGVTVPVVFELQRA